MRRRTPEASGENVNRPDVSEPGKPVVERVICCTDCRRGFFVEAPPYATRLRLAAYLNSRFPTCPGHPVFPKSGTLEIFPHELPPEKSPEAIALENNFRQRKPQRFKPETIRKRDEEKERFRRRAQTAVELSEKGLNYRQIAKELGFKNSSSVVHLIRGSRQSREATK